MGLLDGKVAVITGSGNGIGRTHALLFAEHGAKVVVNDLGGSRDGTGSGAKFADQVVDEIRAAGGEAVANYDSVADFDGAQRIIQTGLDAFGRVDILVNNAGILRDKTLVKMEEGQFDLVHAVHLKGTWNCSKHFAIAMANAAPGQGGRIINTSSIAGLKGNYGQTNYGSAKAGIWGMTLTLALELRKLGVTANVIAPMAKTRMTEDIDMVPDHMKPEYISAVVLWLASDLAAGVTGRCFGIHGQQIFEYRMEMTEGVEKQGEEPWTPAEIQAALPRIERLGPPPAPAGASTGAARALSDADLVEVLVHDMPGALKKDKAASVDATFHLHIKGANPYTIAVKNGACTVEAGHKGQATCNIKTDAASYLAMARGQLNPQKAFMEGKISADNLAAAMQYGSIFRQPKPDEVEAKIAAARAAAAGEATATAAPAAAQWTDEQKIDRVFERFPQIFVADKATGWEAEVLWTIEGAGDYTIFVTAGTCSTKKGKGDKPTCLVKLSAATMLGMVDGTVNPQNAFMQGKISATNLADMMRFGTAFDMKKARKIAEEAKAAAAPKGAGPAPAPAPAAPPAAEPTPAELAREAFDRMPEILIKEKASGWNAEILWTVEGAGDFTVRVKDGACETAAGRPTTPTCTVKLKVETFLGMIVGKVDPQRAFMEGKVTADNLGDMMRFSQAFDMKKGAALAQAAETSRRAARDAAAKAAPPSTLSAAGPAAAPKKPEGLNRDLLGKRYLGGAHFARPDMIEAYARATNDPNPHYLGEAEPHVAPPVFPVRLMKEALFKAVMDRDLGVDVMTMVHGEQDMRFHRPIHPWDLVTVRAYVDSITDKSSGQLVTLRVPCYVEGEVACEARATLFCKSGVRGPKKAESAQEATEVSEREVAFESQIEVAPDQATRYAAASGDDNPIHLDENVAKMAGLPGVILHGLCTMAFASRAVVQEACGGDPTRLRRLGVRFSKPVLLDQTLTTRGWKSDPSNGAVAYEFEMTAADGSKVITNGVAEVV